jgi:NitT/TauT family transport system substrate-binding protein
MKSVRKAFLAALMLLAPMAPASALDHVKIGTLLTTGGVPLYLAVQNGYFAAEGIDAEIVPFDAGQPVAVAAVSGAIDFGDAGITSALYTFAGQGALKIIAGADYDNEKHHAAAMLASNAAYAAGLRSVKDLGGHSVGLTQIGSSYEYALALLSQKYGFDMKTIRMLPLQSFGNVASAVSGGQADAVVMVTAVSLQLLQHDKAKLLTWVGDVTPWQVAVIWTATKTANERPDLVDRFLRALRKGARASNAAFVNAKGERADGPSAPTVIAVTRKYVHLSPADIDANVGYVDPDLRIDAKDIQRQIDWYRSQGMIKVPVTLDQVFDKRTIKMLPTK